MGIFRDALKVNALSSSELAEKMGFTVSTTGGITKAGEYVTSDNALRLAAVYSCIKIITQTFAATPLFLMMDKDNGVKEKASKHKLYHLLKNEAIEGVPAFRWREESMMDLLTDGNAFAQIIRNSRGEIVALNHISAKSVEIIEEESNILYQVTDSHGNIYKLTRYQMMHIPALGNCKGRGLSPIGLAKESIGKAVAAAGYGSEFFKGGGQAQAVVGVVDGVAKNKASFDEFKKEWEKSYGQNSRNKTIFLSGGISYNRLTVTPEEAQFLETIKATTREICGIYGVPPHMVGDLERATFSNIEHQAIEFIQNTMVPWFVRFESYIDTCLLTQKEREQGYYTKFNTNSWLRGDSASRASMYQMMRQNGIMNADEIRALEDMNPQKGNTGKQYLVNSAMNSIGESKTESEE